MVYQLQIMDFHHQHFLDMLRLIPMVFELCNWIYIDIYVYELHGELQHEEAKFDVIDETIPKYWSNRGCFINTIVS